MVRFGALGAAEALEAILWNSRRHLEIGAKGGLFFIHFPGLGLGGETLAAARPSLFHRTAARLATLGSGSQPGRIGCNQQNIGYRRLTLKTDGERRKGGDFTCRIMDLKSFTERMERRNTICTHLFFEDFS